MMNFISTVHGLCLSALLALVTAVAAHAANPYLVKDIHTVAAPGSSSPANGVVFNGQLYFAASTPDAGTELWRSDGTSAGTVLVKDINPGSAGSSPANLTVMGAALYFSASDGTNGTELWKTDGTAAGTVMVRDINVAPGAGSSPSHLAVLGTTLFFAAGDSLGTELWMSDGTAKGTVMVADINAGSGSAAVAYLEVLGSYVYFRAYDPANGYALWKTNGTTTMMIPGTAGSYPAYLTTVGTYLYYQGYDATNGYSLWRTNGTTITLIAGTEGTYPANLAAMSGYLYYQAYDATNGYALWRSSGSTPTMVTGTSGTSPSNLAVFGSYLYFQGTDGTYGSELWRCSGTTASRVFDINPGTGGSNPSHLVTMGSFLYFQANDGTHGSELWRTDGTSATLFKDINATAGTLSASPANLTVIGSTIYFTADNGTNGTELWKSDGVATTLIDINPGSAGSNPANLTVLGTTLYFTATHPSYGTELWKYNGTTATVIDVNPGTASSSPANLEVVGTTLYFSATHVSYGTELWKYNGTTATVHDIVAGTGSSYPGSLTAVGSIDLLFTANDGTSGTELWRVQTSGSPFMVKNINTAAGIGSSIANLKAVGLVLYFSANDGTSGTELWKSNGTDAGTTMVADINPGAASSSPTNLAAVGSTLYFRATNGINGSELWRSDGTANGTAMVKDINAGSASSSPSNLTAIGSTLYFAASNGTNGSELWRSNGTTAGTVLVKDIYPGVTGSSAAHLTAVGSLLYFQATSSATGSELWRSDGTAAGTIAVGEINPGPLGTSPANLAVMNGIVYFQATDPLYGSELFAFNTTYPTGTITAGGSNNVTSTSITLELSCSDSGGACSQMQFSTDNLSWTSPESFATTKAWTIPAGDGTKLIYVRYMDASGNWSSPYQVRVVLDSVTPQTYLTSYPPATTTSKATTFHFTSQESTNFECWLDEDATGYQPCTSPWTDTLYGGTHIFKVRAVDPAGHVDSTPASYEWMILDEIGQTAFAWGKNTFGQLGNGESGRLANEVISQVTGAMGFVSIAGGGSHSAGIRNDGTVWTWGSNANGQLGHNYPNNSAVPKQVPGLKEIVSVTAGAAFTLAAGADGTVWIWGKEPATGTVISVPQQLSGLSGITAVSAGDHHALALASNGTVWTWGVDTNGELGQNSYGFTQTTPVQVKDAGGILTGVTAISAGKDHSLAIKRNASSRYVVLTWGYNSSGQLGFYPGSPGTDSRLVLATEMSTPTGMCDAISIAAGETHSAFVYTSTTTVCGDSPPYAYTAGAPGDGELGTTASCSSAPCKITDVTNVSKVAVSKNNTYFLTAADVVWASGNNQYGQLGTGLHDNQNHYTPVKVGYLSGAEDVAAGSGFALSLKTAWNTGVADSTPNSGRYSSLAVDSSDRVHISYSSNGYPAYTTNAGGTWAATVIDPVLETRGTAITLDAAGNPHVCSLSWNGSNVVIRYITKSGGTWLNPVTIADLTDNPGTNVGSRCDIAVQGSNVYIAYIDASTPNTNPQGRGILKLARKVGATWTIYSIDDPGVLNRYAGLHLSLAVDTAGYAHITYKYQTGEFRYAYVLPGNTPVISMIAYTGFSDTHITLDANGKPHVAYCGSGMLRYATNASGSWVHSTIDDSEPELCETGLATSIAFRPGDSSSPYISYYDNINEDLKVAYFKNNKWIKSGVDTDGVVGKYSSIGIDSLGKVHVSYFDDTEPNFYLKYASNSDYIRPTGTITINGGAAYTTSTDAVLTLSCSDGDGGIGCWQMKFSLDSGVTWTFPEPYATGKTITLPSGNGLKAVQVRFEDSANNWSTVYTQYITLDTTAATGTVAINNNPVPDRTRNGLVLLTLAATDANNVTEMSLSNDGSTWYTFPYATSFGWSLSPGDGTKIVLAKFKDSAGNWSDPAADSILLDTTAPISNASPGGGSRDTAVSVSLSCSDGSGSGCGATYYTTDGTVPTVSSPRYSGVPIVMSGLQSSMQLRYFSVDNLGNTEPVRTETYTFVAGYTALTLDLASPTLVQDGTLDVSGKLTRYPDSEALPNNGMDLSGLPLVVTITGPAGSPCAGGCIENTVTYSSLGHYHIQSIDRFSHKGVYSITAGFAGTGLHLPSASTAQSLLVGTSAGYAIIVEGKVVGDEGLDSHNKTVNRVYEALKERGFVDDNIMYFNYAGVVVPGVDAVPSKTAVQAAIQTWAAERMNGSPAPLYLIMVDHGNNGTFYLDPDTITPTELNGWLETLEGGLNSLARQEKRIIILGACYSGSFMYDLRKAPVPGVNGGRILITSAADNEQSYRGPNEPDGVRSGEFFIEELFKQLKKGLSFTGAFTEAAAQTRTYTAQGSGIAVAANGYGDTSVQHPLLDDNGDGVGGNTLIDGVGDGVEAAQTYLGFGLTNASLGPADIKAVTSSAFLPYSESAVTTPLWLEPYSSSAVSSAWLEIKAPTTALTGDAGSSQLALDLPTTSLELQVSGKWTPAAGTDPTFSAAGRFEVFYFTRSTNAEISEMKRSVVYKNRSGNLPPATFNLVTPGAGGITQVLRTEEVNLAWEASSDADGLTYTVQIATDGGFTSIAYQKEELTSTWHYIDSSALSDQTTYYWRVLAVDGYGEIRYCNQNWSFRTDNTNALPGRVRGYVYDNATPTGVGVATATVTLKAGAAIVAQAMSGTGGAFVFLVPPGSYTLAATASGYLDGDSGSFILASGGTTDTSVTVTVSTPSLQITTSGSGSGTVTASGGISCTSGSSSNCGASYGNGTSVTVTATPDWKSLFGDWSGAYSGSTNPLDLTMNYHKSLAAAFTPNLQARVAAMDYATLQGAYNASADGAVIRARVYTFHENLLFDQNRTVTLDGGKDPAYSATAGTTTVQGTMTIRQGRVNVKKLSVK